jgi:hypothetical protein
MAPSRVADDFRLELRAAAPRQIEENAVRDFVAWLRSGVDVVDVAVSPASDEAAWLAALRAAVQPWTDAFTASPPVSPPTPDSLGDFLFDVSPPTITISRSDLGRFLRVALRFWVTQLRPWWMARTCAGPEGRDDDCLLLAQLQLPVIFAGGSPAGEWEVNGGPDAVILDEASRPILAHLRVLEELLIGGAQLDPAPPPSQALGTSDAPTFSGLQTTGAVQIAVATTNVDLALNASHHLLICDGGQNITLPKCAPDNLGRMYIVKSVSSQSKLNSDAADNVDAFGTTFTIKKANAVTVVSDGVSTWHVVATVA